MTDTGWRGIETDRPRRLLNRVVSIAHISKGASAHRDGPPAWDSCWGGLFFSVTRLFTAFLPGFLLGFLTEVWRRGLMRRPLRPFPGKLRSAFDGADRCSTTFLLHRVGSVEEQWANLTDGEQGNVSGELSVSRGSRTGSLRRPSRGAVSGG